MAIVTASVGVILLGIGCAGYLFRPLGWAKRGLLWVASPLLLIPSWSGVWLMIGAVGFCPWSHPRPWEWNRSAQARRAYRSGEQRSVTNYPYRPVLQVRLRISGPFFALSERKIQRFCVSGFLSRALRARDGLTPPAILSRK